MGSSQDWFNLEYPTTDWDFFLHADEPVSERAYQGDNWDVIWYTSTKASDNLVIYIA